MVLIYDISRWGRFQDTDESASYEYICRKQGIEVLYCAEQFVNDGSAVTTIVKNVKRAMAALYSHDLSYKVFVGQCRLIGLGYRQGGAAGFGLRRDRVGGALGRIRVRAADSLLVAADDEAIAQLAENTGFITADTSAVQRYRRRRAPVTKIQMGRQALNSSSTTPPCDTPASLDRMPPSCPGT